MYRGKLSVEEEFLWGLLRWRLEGCRQLDEGFLRGIAAAWAPDKEFRSPARCSSPFSPWLTDASEKMKNSLRPPTVISLGRNPEVSIIL